MSKEYPSTMIIFYQSGENEIITFGTKKEMPKEIKNEFWVSSNAWRGYTEWKLSKGYVEIADGWITGFPDENTSRKIELNEIFGKMKEGEIKPPCKIYWIFGITSNVFSQASKVFIEAGNEELVEKWLNEINGGVEDFKNMLS